ncbi:MAG: hypothetical protein HY429_04240 [Candidatus Levybacteria bacterium]|nr:hypothetical protein [Candidatus Levybacteria bacterium]
MADRKPPEQQKPVESTPETRFGQGFFRQAIGRVTGLHKQVGHDIETAAVTGAITPAQKATLEEERAGCLTAMLTGVSRVVPNRFKPALYDALQKGELDKVYIAGLNPKNQRAELSQLANVYERQLRYAFYNRNREEAQVSAEKAVDGLIAVCRRKGFDQEAEETICSAIRSISYSLQEDSPVDKEQKITLARKLVAHGVASGTADARRRIIEQFTDHFDDNPSALLTAVPQEERPAIVASIIDQMRFKQGGVVGRSDYIFRLLDTITPQQQYEVMPSLMTYATDTLFRLGDKSLHQEVIPPTTAQIESYAFVKKVLARVDPNHRVAFIAETPEVRWRKIVAGGDGVSQLDQVVNLVEGQDAQEAVFWQIAFDDRDYRGHATFDINAAVARAQPNREKTYFVATQMREGRLSPQACASYGAKLVAQILEEPQIDTQRLASTAIMYGVDMTVHRDRIMEVIEQAFRSGTFTGDRAELARQIGNVALASGWESFRYDAQATQELGEKTWRREQSIIDVLQNHLDANDFRYSYQLVEAALGKNEAEALLASGRIGDVANRLWRFKERHPFPESKQWHYQVYEFKGSADELAQKIAGIKRERPSVQVLISSPDGDNQWVNYDELSNVSQGELQGVRFADNGFGYDEQLQAKFIPTKNDFPFLRGSFGQGAKMSMIALQREGCNVKIGSAYLDPETGERVEWEGTPAVIEATGTVGLHGRRRRSFSTSYLNSTGSVTEIIFRNANPVTKQVFQQMLDVRQDPEGVGLGKYVLDYQRSNTYQYGAFECETQISASPSERGKIFIQGLEIPMSPATFAFGYNLPSSEFLTGRDRTYLELRMTRKNIAEAWSGVTDKDMLRQFYAVVLGQSDRPHAIEKKLMDEFSWQLSEDVRQITRDVLREVLHLDETHQKVVVAEPNILLEKPDVVARLEAAGFSVVGGVYDSASDYHLKYFVDHLFDQETLYDPTTALLEIERGSQKDVLQVPEALTTKLSEMLETARSNARETLALCGFTKDVSKLDEQQLTVEVQKPQKNNKKWIDRVEIYDSEAGGYVGHKIVVYPQNITGAEDAPEAFLAADETFLQFLMEMELTTLTLNGQSWYMAEQARFILAQGIANNIAKAGVDAQSQAHESAQAVTIRPSEVSVSVPSVADVVKQDELAVAVDSRLLPLRSYDADLDEVRESIEGLNGLLLQERVARTKSFSVQSVAGNQYFHNGKLYEIVAEKKDDVLQHIALAEVPYRELGEKEGYKVFLAGEKEQARIVIPLAPGRANMLLRDDRGTTLVSPSEWKETRGRWGRDVVPQDPTSLLREFWKGSFTQEAVVGKNIIAFPIGASSQQAVEKRAAYFLENYTLHIEDGSESYAEVHTGEPYIEATHSIDYGEGKVWDDPRRIFGDVVQNHLDEVGKEMKVTYRVERDGERLWIDEPTLLEPDYANAQIVGVSFSDNGRGYTTRGALVFGEETKRLGGRRGKFGEGLKMLSASCVRNGFDLTLQSRSWSAKVTSRPQQVIAHGRKQTKRMVGFNMEWQEKPREGSITEIMLPEVEVGPYAQRTWSEWVDIIDPRKTNELGHKGLERYVRVMRKNERAIKVGNVTFLPDEQNTFYEGGIVIPDAEKRLEKKYLFGYDVDGDLVGTQERNVVDAEKLSGHLQRAFASLPVEVCQRLLEEVRHQVSPYAHDVKATFEEFALVRALQHIEPLRLAYYKTYGEYALLSSASAAKFELRYGTGANDAPLTDEERMILKSIIEYEDRHLPKDMLVQMDSRHYEIMKKLEGHVRTTKEQLQSIIQEPRATTEEERGQITQVVQATAQSMTTTLQRLYDSPKGREILRRLMEYSDRRKITVKGETDVKQASETEYEDVENILFYLEAVAQGLLPIEIQVKNAAMTAEAHVFGENGIAYAERIFADPAHTVAVTEHELLHLASNTGDYNTTFVGLLMLMNPHVAARFSQ